LIAIWKSIRRALSSLSMASDALKVRACLDTRRCREDEGRSGSWLHDHHQAVPKYIALCSMDQGHGHGYPCSIWCTFAMFTYHIGYDWYSDALVSSGAQRLMINTQGYFSWSV
jgi:hypothetical protein